VELGIAWLKVLFLQWNIIVYMALLQSIRPSVEFPLNQGLRLIWSQYNVKTATAAPIYRLDNSMDS
jgi:hypothetical protein